MSARTFTGRASIGRAAEAAGWILPAATLALIPKCPMCVAAYIAVATGFGISFSAAGWIRIGMIIGSVTLLLFVALRRGIRWSRRSERDNLTRCCS